MTRLTPPGSQTARRAESSAVGLGHALQLILLLDGIAAQAQPPGVSIAHRAACWRFAMRSGTWTWTAILARTKPVRLQASVPVGRALCGVDELIRQALCNGLDVAERAFARAGGQQVDGAVHAPQRRDVHRLPPDHTRAADARGVLARAAAWARRVSATLRYGTVPYQAAKGVCRTC